MNRKNVLLKGRIYTEITMLHKNAKIILKILLKIPYLLLFISSAIYHIYNNLKLLEHISMHAHTHTHIHTHEDVMIFLDNYQIY